MKFEKGVDISGVRPEIALAMVIVDGLYNSCGRELVVTAVKDGKHGFGSLHYVGLAFDCRSSYFKDREKALIVNDIKNALGAQFDVVNEKTHIHIEYQPK